jgi:predicted AlkP superfamily pyrophosphatase or phosphodiesterase
MRWHSAGVAAALCALLTACGGRTQPATVPSRIAPQTVVMISLDGFRWDYLDRAPAVRMRQLAARGVRAERLVPSFPTKTYPNHYALVTGLYPEHNGIVANAMQDSVLGHFAIGDDPAVRDARWWFGEPIWTTAVKQGMRTAAYFWPGSEAPIGGVRPTWYKKYDGNVPNADRVRGILEWLAMRPDSAPRLINAYFSDADDAGHKYGPDAIETDSAIARLDSAVSAVMDGITRLGLERTVDLIIVSDHGMAEIRPNRVVYLDDYVSLDSLDVVDWTPIAAIAPKAGHDAYVYNKLKGANPHLAIYRKADVPARLNFNSGSRITPIVGIADEGWSITTHARFAKATPWTIGGAHGYDNQIVSMGALFIAAGPAFRQGLRVPPFQNVHVYALVAEILHLRPAKTDGSIDSVRVLLR